MIKDSFTLAFGNLRHRGLRSWLTILGIFIGIAAVVSLISLGAGLQEAITGQFATLDVDKLIIQNANTGFGPPGSTAIRKLTEHDLELVEEVSGVEMAIPRLVRVVQIEFNNQNNFNYIGSVTEDSEEIDVIIDSLNVKVQEGKFLEKTDIGKVVLGNDFLDEDIFGKQIRVGTRLKIQGKDFEVIGIMERASTFTVNSVVFILESDMKDILNIGDEIDVIIAQVENPEKIDEVAENLERKFRKDRKLDLGEDDFSVQTPSEGVETVNVILGIVNLIVSGIAAISLLVGGIGIANTMYTSVLERTREIGVMKAVGAKNKDIMLMFIIEAGLLGLVGGVVGAIIGLSLAFGISSLVGNFLGGLELKVTFSPALMLGSIGFSFFIGILSGIIPAIQASRLNIVDALRS